MSKDLHMKMDDRLAAAISAWAASHGIGFGAAVSVLAAHGLHGEGISIDQDEPGQEIRR